MEKVIPKFLKQHNVVLTCNTQQSKRKPPFPSATTPQLLLRSRSTPHWHLHMIFMIPYTINTLRFPLQRSSIFSIWVTSSSGKVNSVTMVSFSSLGLCVDPCDKVSSERIGWCRSILVSEGSFTDIKTENETDNKDWYSGKANLSAFWMEVRSQALKSTQPPQIFTPSLETSLPHVKEIQICFQDTSIFKSTVLF